MLNRREFVAASSLLASGSAFAFSRTNRPIDCGWIDSARDRRRSRPRTSRVAHNIVGTGQNKVIRLWKALEKASGAEFENHVQLGNDCVGQAAGLGVDILSAVQALYHNDEWKGKHSTETLYAGSRYEIFVKKYGGSIGWLPHQLSSQGGSTGGWVTEFLSDYGALLRGIYDDDDLRKYNYDLVREWADIGIPTELEELSQVHPVKQPTLIDGGWPQACDLLANGYPVLVCSSTGFNKKTDSDGFLTPSGMWMHAMLLVGADTRSRRQGGCFANSWPEQWVSGRPHKYGTPRSGFWADADVIDKMLSLGDSYGFCHFQGYRRRNLDYVLG